MRFFLAIWSLELPFKIEWFYALLFFHYVLFQRRPPTLIKICVYVCIIISVCSCFYVCVRVYGRFICSVQKLSHDCAVHWNILRLNTNITKTQKTWAAFAAPLSLFLRTRTQLRCHAGWSRLETLSSLLENAAPPLTKLHRSRFATS